MKCMHCLVEFHAEEEFTPIARDADGAWAVICYHCPSCNRANLYLINGSNFVETSSRFGPNDMVNRGAPFPVRPRASSRPPCPAQVPVDIAQDYAEACLVLPDSRKASAALSRRCLQNVLRDAAGIKPGDLANEIQQVIDSHQSPSNLADAVDVVRVTGNFAAHPTKSKSTGEIVPVEPQEAEWNLEVLEELFDHYYVKPARLAQKRAALNAKLEDAGKPPMK